MFFLKVILQSNISECPIPKCPEEWELNLEIEGDDVVCPQYTCQPPDITTPMSCPSPLCPFGYNIILVPKKVSAKIFKIRVNRLRY